MSKKHSVPMNKRRLGTLARWLEAGAPHKHNVIAFNMRFGVKYEKRMDNAEEMLGCGTTCCLAGAAVQFFNNPVEFARKQLLRGYISEEGLDSRWADISEEGANLLGLRWEDADALFMAAPTMRCTITPAWAARCVRKFIKTGNVDWLGTRFVR